MFKRMSATIQIRDAAERPTVDELRARLRSRSASAPTPTPAKAVRDERGELRAPHSG
jgi:hypothetical protein